MSQTRNGPIHRWDPARTLVEAHTKTSCATCGGQRAPIHITITDTKGVIERFYCSRSCFIKGTKSLALVL